MSLPILYTQPSMHETGGFSDLSELSQSKPLILHHPQGDTGDESSMSWLYDFYPGIFRLVSLKIHCSSHKLSINWFFIFTRKRKVLMLFFSIVVIQKWNRFLTRPQRPQICTLTSMLVPESSLPRQPHSLWLLPLCRYHNMMWSSEESPQLLYSAARKSDTLKSQCILLVHTCCACVCVRACGVFSLVYVCVCACCVRVECLAWCVCVRVECLVWCVCVRVECLVWCVCVCVCACGVFSLACEGCCVQIWSDVRGSSLYCSADRWRHTHLSQQMYSHISLKKIHV